MPLTKQYAVTTDTHALRWRVDDTSGTVPVPVDVTDATVEFHFKPKTGATVVGAGSVDDGPAGIIKHQLTGTLPAGEYGVEAELTIDGVQTTAPTIKVGTLIMRAAL